MSNKALEELANKQKSYRPPRSMLWIIGAVGLIGVWSSQPYYGWSFCVVPVGIYQETDFVEALYQPVLERAIGRNRGEEDRIEEVVRSAFDLMKECVAKRGIELCRYVGPDENASVLKQQHPVRIPREEQDIFR